MDDDRRRGIGWALGAAVGIAGWALPWKLAAGEGAAPVNALLLLAFAAAFNSGFNLVRSRGAPSLTRFDWLLGAVLAVFTLIGNAASAQAIQALSPAMLTVAQRGEIIVVALMAWPLIGERPDRPFWVGAAVAGVGLLIVQAPFEAGDARAVGFAWAGFSVLSFAGMVVVTRRFIQRFDPARVNGLRLWLSVAIWFAWYGVPAELSEITPAQALYTSMAAFCGPFAGRLAMMTSSRYIEARLTTLATLAAPPLTVLLGLVLLAETPSPRELIGGLVMLAGVAIPVLRAPRGELPPRRR